MNELIRIVAIGLCLVFISRLCQSAARPNGREARPAETYHLVEAGPHHSVFEAETEGPTQGSTIDSPAGRYVELASGLNRYDDKQRQWVPAEAVFEKTRKGGMVARRTQHQLILPADLAKEPIDMLCPDGTRLISAPLGLALLDLRTGESVLVAELKPCAATLAAASTVVYEDCFSGIRADLVYDLRLGSLEQDLVLREQLPPPEQFGMDPDHVRVQVLTEFFAAPEPGRDRRMVKEASKGDRSLRRVAPDLVDEELSFGESMRMLRGRAFSVGEDAASPEAGAPVGKSFETLEGRRFLVESTEYSDLAPRLRSLPFRKRVGDENGFRSAGVEPGTRLRRLPERTWRTPKWVRHGFEERLIEKQWASIGERDAPEIGTREYLAMSGDGLVLDYTLGSHQSDFVFEAGTTYYVTDRIFLSGTTILEGGAVIKYPPTSLASAGVVVNGSLVCRTSAYRPAIFTARDDDTVGLQLPESTGVVHGHYGYTGLWLYHSNTPDLVEHVMLRFSTFGILFFGDSEHTVRHSRIVHSMVGIYGYGGRDGVKLRNVLLDGDGAGFYAFYVYASTPGIDAQHVTVRNYPTLHANSGPVALKNSLVVRVANPGSYTGVCTKWLPSDAGVFVRAGAGAHYLPANSPYRNVGTTDVEAALLEEIRWMTTSPPEALQGELSADTVLTPLSGRDTDTPDLGYHYPALDYLLEDLALDDVDLHLAGGVVIAVRGETGFLVRGDARLASVGSPARLNRLIRHTFVQEQHDPSGAPLGALLLVRPEWPLTGVPEVDLRFTELSASASGPSRNRLYHSGGQPVRIRISDCRVLNVGAFVYGAGPRGASVDLTNNLVEHGSFDFFQGYFSQTDPLDVSLRNNLFRGGYLWLVYRNATGDWTIRDNLLDGVMVVKDLYPTDDPLPATHNAFHNALEFGQNRRYPVQCDYRSGPLGDYYYPASGDGLAGLIDAGSQTAAGAGLYHYTTCPGLGPEGESPVDIGFHYVGMSADGARPADTDEDGLPDYREDVNGNGAYDPSEGETDWLRPEGFVGAPPRLVVFTTLEPAL